MNIEQQARECAEKCATESCEYHSNAFRAKTLADVITPIILAAMRRVVRYELGRRGHLQGCGDCDPCIGGRPDQCAVGAFEVPRGFCMACGYETPAAKPGPLPPMETAPCIANEPCPKCGETVADLDSHKCKTKNLEPCPDCNCCGSHETDCPTLINEMRERGILPPETGTGGDLLFTPSGKSESFIVCPSGKRVTVAELEAILADPTPRKIVVNPDGSISATPLETLESLRRERDEAREAFRNSQGLHSADAKVWTDTVERLTKERDHIDGQLQNMARANGLHMADIEKKRAALEPFAHHSGHFTSEYSDSFGTLVSLGHCRAAKAAISEAGPDPVAELRELHIMQLAGISTACLQNTERSIKDRIGRDNPYWTVAYGDACVAIDREMALRAECERLGKDARELKKLAADAQDEVAICRAENIRLRRELKEGVWLIDSATKMHDDLQSKLGTVEKECERLRGDVTDLGLRNNSLHGDNDTLRKDLGAAALVNEDQRKQLVLLRKEKERERLRGELKAKGGV